MLGADGDGIGKSQAGEFGGADGVLIDIDLVDGEEERLGGAAHQFGEVLVQRRETVLPVDDEEEHVGRGEGDIDFGVNLFGEARVHFCPNAAGVDDLERVVAQFALRRDAITGDPGHVVDDGNLPPRETVKEGGFADIRTADDGDCAGHFWES